MGRAVGDRLSGQWAGKDGDFVKRRDLYRRNGGKVGLGHDQIHRETRRKACAQDSFHKSPTKDDGVRTEKVAQDHQETRPNGDKASPTLDNH